MNPILEKSYNLVMVTNRRRTGMREADGSHQYPVHLHLFVNSNNMPPLTKRGTLYKLDVIEFLYGSCRFCSL